LLGAMLVMNMLLSPWETDQYATPEAYKISR